MPQAVPSGRSRVQFSFRADFFRDGFYGFRTGFRKETHTTKTNVGGAYQGCTAQLCVCVDWDNEMLPIGVGSSVSTFLKLVTVSLQSLLALKWKGHEKNTD